MYNGGPYVYLSCESERFEGMIMRIVDIFYCIPSMPVIIILGAAMDGMRVDPQIRMFYLMLIWLLGLAVHRPYGPGQILSLREQEFMTATEPAASAFPAGSSGI